MKTIPTVLAREKNKLFTDSAWIVLLDITLSPEAKLYFCSNNEDVTFAGQLYRAFPFYLEPTKLSSKGEIPTISLRVCNVTQIIHSYLEELNGGVGAEVVVRVVNHAYLAEDYSEMEMTFSVLSSSADAEWVSFTLGSPSPLRRRFPQYRYLAMHCNWDFKGAECGYAGAALTCDRTKSACDALGNIARFGGHPGLSSRGWRMV
jgi:lambda family phage minor tail protein L